ncbi:thioredoxin-dependent thiol peroxidase [bacterium 3DAC]|nr:thioredoxin-dependent thiol peroxidase [bacterium 3DAC]
MPCKKKSPKQQKPWKAPEFCLPDSESNTHCLKDYLKKGWVVLYFYPKANTSGCTKEAIGFTELKDEFEKLGATIIGISPDKPEKIKKFIEDHDLKILLLSDTEKEVLKAYGAWGKKKNYGREYEGVIRSTFIINPDGMVVKSWKNVRVKGHMEKVLETLKKLVEEYEG